MANILVTGGAGYIGSHVCKALTVAGHVPIVYDNLSHGYREFVKWGILEVGDICDEERIHGVMLKYKPQAVMHFAGLINVGESAASPLHYYRTNVNGLTCVLHAMTGASVSVVIVSSSCAVYGLVANAPIKEDSPLAPINPYGRTKLMMETILADTAEAENLRWIALRYFNAAGADPDGEIGECHEPEAHLIPRVFDVAAGKAAFLVINGDDYLTQDGTCVRDYIHVSDLAVAHCLALDHALAQPVREILNLGTGKGFSVFEIIQAVADITGRKIPIQIGPRRSGDAPTLVADPEKAQRLLRWQPQRSDLYSQVSDAWAWYANRHGITPPP